MSDIYKHTKTGNLYLFLGYVNNSATGDEEVLYQSLYEECRKWTRPVIEFFGKVEINGEMKPRFENIVIKKL